MNLHATRHPVARARRRAARRSAVACLLLLPWTAAATAQTWTDVTPELIDRSSGAMVFLPSPPRFFLFGGATLSQTHGSTWEFDGANWQRLSPPVAPSPRAAPAMGYDTARNRTILFGGLASSVSLNDTWQWDGAAWTQLSPATIPTARNSSAMAYDTNRARLVMFGGLTTTYANDTWEWTGTDWTSITTATTPPGRGGHALTWDGGQIVLFGGQDNLNSRSDVWRYNGSNWSSVAASGPIGRYGHRMTFLPPNRVLMYGGWSQAQGIVGDAWVLQGSTWQQFLSPTPGRRALHHMAYDSVNNRTLAFGGYDFNYLADAWSYDGVSWTKVSNGNAPIGRYGHASCFDRPSGRTVLVGGVERFGAALGDSWEWDGARFTERTGFTPTARSFGAMACAGPSGPSVLFGGRSATSSPMSDTWYFGASGWTQGPQVVVPNPPPRYGHAMAWDEDRGRIVMFGGRGSSGLLADTWEWNSATAWQPQSPPTTPPARESHALIHSPERQAIVLQGGRNGATLDDTWEYDGVDWRLLATGGPAHSEPILLFDAPRATMILQTVAAGGLARTDQWTGLGWPPFSSSTSAGNVGRHSGAPAVMDSARDVGVLFGGLDLSTYRRDVWEWSWPASASFRTFGVTCPDSAGFGQGLGQLAPAVPGQTWSVRVSGGVPGALSVLIGGTSNALLDNSIRLPVSLLGIPGCSLYTGNDALSLLFVVGANPTVFNLAIPPFLTGFRFYCQAIELDPAANPQGLVSSHGASVLIGP
ncbi:MAG: kelch repeat-containing protein [Planctomycetota bacterium]